MDCVLYLLFLWNSWYVYVYESNLLQLHCIAYMHACSLNSYNTNTCMYKKKIACSCIVHVGMSMYFSILHASSRRLLNAHYTPLSLYTNACMLYACIMPRIPPHSIHHLSHHQSTTFSSRSTRARCNRVSMHGQRVWHLVRERHRIGRYKRCHVSKSRHHLLGHRGPERGRKRRNELDPARGETPRKQRHADPVLCVRQRCRNKSLRIVDDSW